MYQAYQVKCPFTFDKLTKVLQNFERTSLLDSNEGKHQMHSSHQYWNCAYLEFVIDLDLESRYILKCINDCQGYNNIYKLFPANNDNWVLLDAALIGLVIVSDTFCWKEVESA